MQSIILEKPIGTPAGCYQVSQKAGKRSLFVQSDRDYCRLANSFGWTPSQAYGVWIDPSIPKTANGDDNYCLHVNTDGTIPCACGCQPADFIESARDYLEENIGAVADDPGYFEDDTPVLIEWGPKIREVWPGDKE